MGRKDREEDEGGTAGPRRPRAQECQPERLRGTAASAPALEDEDALVGVSSSELLPSDDAVRARFDSETEVHEYDCTEIEFGADSKFGHGWTELRKHLYGGARHLPGKSGCLSWGWGMHNECVLEAVKWRASREDAADELTHYDFVWVFEEDVGFSGANVVEDLVVPYSRFDRESDLLTSAYVPVSREWVWHHTMTGEFYRRTDHLRERLNSPEHVQRLSKKFLVEVAEWSQAGAVAWSEI
eukprot:g8069.t1